ncbi:MAG: sigma-54-dependent transcriptional regulator [Candidatus Eiseniibacteriota bacterium]
MPSVLIVDDEPNIRSSLEGALGREGYQPESAGDLAAARARLGESFDFVLLDVRLPDGSGVDLLEEIRQATPDTVVIVMSGHATIEDAVRATRLGAFDFLEKPLALERLLVMLRNAADSRALRTEVRELRRPWAQPIVGKSAAIARLLEEVQRAGASSARVLIQGEHGTGKELVARALHAAGARRAMPFVAVNCAAIPEELVESELFGHEKGAFSGAAQARRGRFEEAHLGTLFLDEVGDLSPRAQTKLLRVLQEGELTHVGGNRTIRVDARVISATNQDLPARAKTGAFREDLYFRLAVIPVTAPPLRERREDIPALIRHFEVQLARESGLPGRRFSAEAVRLMTAPYDYPGNVRELRNLVERLMIMSPGAAIGAEEVRRMLPRAEAAAGGVTLVERLRATEREIIEAALRESGGRVSEAAARLGLERSHLYKKMRKHGLSP